MPVICTQLLIAVSYLLVVRIFAKLHAINWYRRGFSVQTGWWILIKLILLGWYKLCGVNSMFVHIGCNKMSASCDIATKCLLHVTLQQNVCFKWRCNKMSASCDIATKCLLQVTLQQNVCFKWRCNKMSASSEVATKYLLNVTFELNLSSVWNFWSYRK